MNINELVIYRNLKHEDLFEDMASLMGLGSSEKKADAFGCAGQLVELAVEYGFEGNLWHCFLALCLADNENAYTTTCEIRGNAGGTLDMLARNDYRIFKALFDFNIETLEPAVMWKELADYRPSNQESRVFNRRIRDRIVDLAVLLERSADETEFQSHMAAFYGEYGVGKFGLNKAFRIIEKEDEHQFIIDPIINVEHVYFKDIVGYEAQKKKLIENTEEKVAPPPPEVAPINETLEIVADDADVEETVIASSEETGKAVEVKYVPVTVVEEEPEEQTIFEVVEQMPEFPNGGMAGLMQFLSKNIKYPTIAQENGTQGRVTVQFVVNKDGSIVDAKVIRGVDPYLDKEALRVIGTMPKWKPGMQRGKPVRVKYTVPVMFRLQ